MKLGLISDIHEHVEHLRSALEFLKAEHVDQIVVLGDVCEMGHRLEETCRLLAEAKAIGVWGNHDFGMCCDVTEELRRRYSPLVLDYLGSLRPRLDLDGCHFTHVEPWLDPTNIADLWYFDGLPDEQHKLDRIFAATPYRLLFAGHFHTWLLATPDGIRDWNGEATVRLDRGRYFVVIGAVCDGHCATFDTETCSLRPCRLGCPA